MAVARTWTSRFAEFGSGIYDGTSGPERDQMGRIRGTSMPHLVDGYNLLFASGILRRRVGPGGLEKARRALVHIVAESLGPEEAQRTTFVFDASGAPPDASLEKSIQGVRLLFARNHEDADALIEELIEKDTAPKQLVVVSSDHRLQRAARRRRAKAQDSDTWFAQILALRRKRQAPVDAQPDRSPVLSDAEVNDWLRQFGDLDASEFPTSSIFPLDYFQEDAEEP
jgi:predicted RNA-binding protein with PIN domain